jgi:type II secretory pathway pseudopilin PulG
MIFYKKNSKGFTLIDILLVSAIVSLLSSLFLFQVGEARKKADDAHMQVEARQVSNSVALYKNDNNGRAPLTSTGPGSPRTGIPHYENDPGSDYVPTMQTLVDSGYLGEIPTSPSGNSYTYAVSDDFQEAVFVFKTNRNGNSCEVIGGTSSTSTEFCDSILAAIDRDNDDDDDDEDEERYTNNNDGTVKDNSTGLTWSQDGSEGGALWNDAMSICQDNLKGLPGSGWRLPSIGEIQSIIELDQGIPPMNPIFTNIQIEGGYWSSTQEPGKWWSAYYYWMGAETNEIYEDPTPQTKVIGIYSLGGYVLCVR